MVTEQKERAADFLRRHNMHPESFRLPELTAAFREEMERGLRGEASSLLMIPSFLTVRQQPRAGETALVMDAGGTNLRAARVRFDEAGTMTVEDLRRTAMPGAGGEALDAPEFFRRIAAFAAPLAEGCASACIGFSYPCEVLPDGDGRILSLNKELQVSGAEGLLVCRSLEQALQAAGAAGSRRWVLVNDTVATLLCGMAAASGKKYDGWLGFILGTGTNLCLQVPAAEIVKSPEASARSGLMPVNTESGGFDRIPRGTADILLDEESEHPGEHPAEKMISGRYYAELLMRTIFLAVERAELPASVGVNLMAEPVTGEEISLFSESPAAESRFRLNLETPKTIAWVAGLNELLLTRAACLTAACLAAAAEYGNLPAGSRVCICADGSMITKNRAFREKTEAFLKEELGPRGITAEFLFVEDASILGCARAALGTEAGA